MVAGQGDDTANQVKMIGSIMGLLCLLIANNVVYMLFLKMLVGIVA